METPGDKQLMVVEMSSVHTGKFVLHTISLSENPFSQGGRSEFGTFSPQE